MHDPFQTFSDQFSHSALHSIKGIIEIQTLEPSPKPELDLDPIVSCVWALPIVIDLPALA